MMLHLINEDNEDMSLCGVALKPEDTPEGEQDWCQERDETTCDECANISDEAAAERQADGYGFDLEGYWADVAVEESRGIYA